jgi:hypothetical protein
LLIKLIINFIIFIIWEFLFLCLCDEKITKKNIWFCDLLMCIYNMNFVNVIDIIDIVSCSCVQTGLISWVNRRKNFWLTFFFRSRSTTDQIILSPFFLSNWINRQLKKSNFIIFIICEFPFLCLCDEKITKKNICFCGLLMCIYNMNFVNVIDIIDIVCCSCVQTGLISWVNRRENFWLTFFF